LLLPASAEELRRTVALAELAAAAEQPEYRSYRPYFQFVRGLADYRQGRFDLATSALRSAVSGMTGPSPRLVLAMALHQSGHQSEARRTLTEAIQRYDWQSSKIRDQDGWIAHVLRREAETVIPRTP